MAFSAAFGIGASGMRAAQRDADVRANNLANANTPGYRRTDFNYIEQAHGGVYGVNIHRFSPDLARRISEAADRAGFTETKQTSLNELQSSLSGMGQTVTGTLTELRESLASAALRPQDPAAREVAAERANSLATQATNSLKALDNQAAGLQSQQNEALNLANAKRDQLFELNRQIGVNGPSAELKNKIAETGRELAELSGGSLSMDEQGYATFTVGGATVVRPDSKLDFPENVGGAIGGFAAARQDVLSARAGLEGSLKSFADSMNNANKSGVTANGTPGGDLYSFDGTSLSFTGNGESFALNKTTAGDSANVNSFLAVKNPGEDMTGLASVAAQKFNSARIDADTAANASAALDVKLKTTEGVNEDEELIKLKTAERLYELNAKVIQTADSMVGTLLSIKA